MSAEPPEAIAYLNDQFVPLSEATLSVADFGVVSGVTLTETLRTFGGRLRFVRQHVERLARGAETLGFPLREPPGGVAEIMYEVIERNASMGWPDTTIVVVATPGLSTVHSLSRSAGPTLCIHARPVGTSLNRIRYLKGQAVQTFTGMHAPTKALPRQVKHRSRLNWWLASRQCDRGVEPLFVDDDGVVTETNTGNVLMVVHNRLILAPEDRVLPGVTQSVVGEVAATAGYTVERRPFTVDDLLAADEVLLSSSNYVLCRVPQIDGSPLPPKSPTRDHTRRLTAAMSARVDFDFVAQAVGDQ